MIVVCRVTTRCNLTCGFCAYDRRLPFARISIHDRAVERLIELLGAHRIAHPQRLLLSWLGGEPLLWRRWQYWSRRARDCGLAVSATTNGSTLQQRAVRAAIIENFSELTISVDAPGVRHDELRGWPGGYERICAAIAALVHERRQIGADLLLRVNVVLMRRTLPQFPTLARELGGLGVDEISFNLLGGRDRPEFFAREAVAPDALNHFLLELPSLRSELAAHGTRILGDSSYGARLAAASRGASWPISDCDPGEQFLFVDERARLSPCAFTGDSLGVPIMELARIEDLGAQFRAMRASRRPQVCNDCPSTQLAGKFVPAAGVDSRLGVPAPKRGNEVLDRESA